MCRLGFYNLTTLYHCGVLKQMVGMNILSQRPLYNFCIVDYSTHFV